MRSVNIKIILQTGSPDLPKIYWRIICQYQVDPVALHDFEEEEKIYIYGHSSVPRRVFTLIGTTAHALKGVAEKFLLLLCTFTKSSMFTILG